MMRFSDRALVLVWMLAACSDDAAGGPGQPAAGGGAQSAELQRFAERLEGIYDFVERRLDLMGCGDGGLSGGQPFVAVYWNDTGLVPSLNAITCETPTGCRDNVQASLSFQPVSVNFRLVFTDVTGEHSLAGKDEYPLQTGSECRQASVRNTLVELEDGSIEVEARTWYGEPYPVSSMDRCARPKVDLQEDSTPCSERNTFTASFLEAL